MAITGNAKKTEKSPTTSVHTKTRKPSIKHIIRGISARGIYDAEAKAYPVEEVEEYINGFLADGYRLAYCQHIGHIKAADGVNVIAEEMLYVLIRD